MDLARAVISEASGGDIWSSWNAGVRSFQLLQISRGRPQAGGGAPTPSA
ncbi:hypothetical protein TP2_10785 [Thioclava pacifica DSM 10166]|uniref:Uncharacterized protein n=1 Tax=Thioclava pacifica DSM 10166 TaxID=1353537 RepID=A0A074J614_9RHOB|nr:hypothetical protein TP2_10785 [Thioclava pacifica DSM 10166]